MFPKDLVKHGRFLYSTWSAHYNAPYRYHSRKYAPLVDKYVDRIVDILQLENPKFIFKPLSKRTNGMAFETMVVYIDPRRATYKEIVHSMCHEAIHLFQIQHGRLRFDQKKGCFLWDGKPHKYVDGLRQFENYLELPWEIDANNKMMSLYFDVMETKEMPIICSKLAP